MPGLLPMCGALFAAALCICICSAIQKLKVRLKIRRALLAMSWSCAFGLTCFAFMSANVASIIEVARCCVTSDGPDLKLAARYATAWACRFNAFGMLFSLVAIVVGFAPTVMRSIASGEGKNAIFAPFCARMARPSVLRALLITSRTASPAAVLQRYNS